MCVVVMLTLKGVSVNEWANGVENKLDRFRWTRKETVTLPSLSTFRFWAKSSSISWTWSRIDANNKVINHSMRMIINRDGFMAMTRGILYALVTRGRSADCHASLFSCINPDFDSGRGREEGSSNIFFRFSPAARPLKPRQVGFIHNRDKWLQRSFIFPLAGFLPMVVLSTTKPPLLPDKIRKELEIEGILNTVKILAMVAMLVFRNISCVMSTSITILITKNSTPNSLSLRRCGNMKPKERTDVGTKGEHFWTRELVDHTMQS